jgi:hypothetical protein
MKQKTTAPSDKHCTGCDTVKPKTHFTKNRSTKDGLQAYCKDCQRVTAAHNYAKRKARHEAAFGTRDEQTAGLRKVGEP